MSNGVVWGNTALEVPEFSDPSFQDILALPLPPNAVLVTRCIVGEQFVLSAYELLQLISLIPNRRTPHYKLLLYQEYPVDF